MPQSSPKSSNKVDDCKSLVAGQWGVFLLLTVLHVLFNVAAVRCLRLTALNRERLRILLRRFRWHRAAARAAVNARLDDPDPSAFRRFPHAARVGGEGVLTPAEVAPLETLLPPQFAWVLAPFVWIATTCQPSRWGCPS
jgi:hypothetical protein